MGPRPQVFDVALIDTQKKDLVNTHPMTNGDAIYRFATDAAGVKQCLVWIQQLCDYGLEQFTHELAEKTTRAITAQENDLPALPSCLSHKDEIAKVGVSP